MLAPGTKVKVGGEVGTVERLIGGGDVLVRTPKGRFAVSASRCEVDAPKPIPQIMTPEAPIRAPEAPPLVVKTLPELRAELKSKGFKVARGATREDMEAALKGE